MADLSAYIAFNVLLNKSVNTPVITLTDPFNYPAGVGIYVTGVFTITQPDGIVVQGSFTSPDITYNTKSTNKELRLSSDGNFQQGLYVISYTVKCTGYTDTQLTKAFNLSYNEATVQITDLTDVFTPSLQQVDSTNYTQTGYNIASKTYSWSAVVNSVNGTVQTITGNAILFNMIYSGSYYDANYAISFQSIVTFTSTTYTYLTLIDKFTSTYSIDAYTPPTLANLLVSLTNLKTQIEAGTYCGQKCGCGTPDYTPFNTAESIYNLIIQRGQEGETVGLDAYITQLLGIFNCTTYRVQTHTNQPIPAYNFGGSTGGVHVPIQFTVGSGAPYAPAAGTFAYNNPTLAGEGTFIVFRQAIGDYLVAGTDFTYNTSGGFTLTNATPQSSAFVSDERFTLIFNTN